MSSMYELDNSIPIQVGDIVALNQITNKVHIASLKDKKRIIGVCTDTFEDGTILVCDNGIVNVNVTGIICLGDNLTISNICGKAEAIPHEQDKDTFDIRSIGKVVSLSDVYSKAMVLLNIE